MGEKGGEVGEKGGGTGGKGGGNWEWGTPLSTPSLKVHRRHLAVNFSMALLISA